MDAFQHWQALKEERGKSEWGPEAPPAFFDTGTDETFLHASAHTTSYA